MKYRLAVLAALAFFVVAAGCKKNPNAIIDLPYGPEYVGEYLKKSDVLRIGHALNTLKTRETVKWENQETGIQFSMMVFSSDQAKGVVTRKFSVLTIEPSGVAEVLNLVGSSNGEATWNIHAESSAASVGQAMRMELEATPVPRASMTSGEGFAGFIVVE